MEWQCECKGNHDLSAYNGKDKYTVKCARCGLTVSIEKADAIEKKIEKIVITGCWCDLGTIDYVIEKMEKNNEN